MKVDFQCGDTITIPEGCKAIVKDGSVVFEREKEENKKEFKRGDVIVSKMNEILLVDRHSFYNRFLRSFVNIREDGSFCESSYSQWNELHTWRYATEEEKQLLFDKMKEKGLKWNAEEKRVEKIRWRAEEGEYYSYVGSNITAVNACRPKDGEFKYDYESNNYFSYNYFRTQEQAEEAAKRMKEVLIQYHEEIGE